MGSDDVVSVLVVSDDELSGNSGVPGSTGGSLDSVVESFSSVEDSSGVSVSDDSVIVGLVSGSVSDSEILGCISDSDGLNSVSLSEVLGLVSGSELLDSVLLSEVLGGVFGSVALGLVSASELLDSVLLSEVLGLVSGSGVLGCVSGSEEFGFVSGWAGLAGRDVPLPRFLGVLVFGGSTRMILGFLGGSGGGCWACRVFSFSWSCGSWAGSVRWMADRSRLFICSSMVSRPKRDRFSQVKFSML